jgi:hypothetical protein
MIHNGFTDRTTAWLLATFMMIFGDVAMASSLKLADPSELAGKWQATLIVRVPGVAGQTVKRLRHRLSTETDAG